MTTRCQCDRCGRTWTHAGPPSSAPFTHYCEIGKPEWGTVTIIPPGVK